MKILEKEIIAKENLFENQIYCINYQKQKLGLYINGEFHFYDKRNKKQIAKYEDVNVFAWCNEYKGEILSEENLSIYETKKQELLNKRAIYTGAFISEKDSKDLYIKMKELFPEIPEDWKKVAHHMTLNLGHCFEDYQKFLYNDYEISIDAFGINFELEVCAVKVSTKIPSKNKTKHITLAISENGKPANSNKIENWTNVEPFVIHATVGEFLNDKTIDYGKNQNIKNNNKFKMK